LEISQIIFSALSPAIRFESFPKSSLDVSIMVLERDGTQATMAGAITCASLALADAGVEMFDLVCGSSAVRSHFENVHHGIAIRYKWITIFSEGVQARLTGSSKYRASRKRELSWT
jgi:hypothetical protein